MIEQGKIVPQQTDPSWLGHYRATLKLGLPLIGVQLAQMAISVTDTLMIGQLGARDLAASVLAAQFFFVSFIICTGFGHALVPLAANAAAQEDVRGVRRATRMGAWAVIGTAALLMPALWMSESILLRLGQEPELAALAAGYLRIAQWGLFSFVLVAVLRGFLAALERTGFVFWATLSAVGLNALLNYILIFGKFGAPAMGLKGAAIASVASMSLTLVMLIGYCLRVPEIRIYTLFRNPLRPEWKMLRQISVMGIAISATLLAEIGLFAAASLMIGRIGTIELAAHGIALQVISVIFMIPLGLSSAATVRAGRAVGRKDPLGLYRAAIMVLAMALGFAAVAALLLWLFPQPLINLFLDERGNPDAEAILSYGIPLLAVAALFQIVDTLQIVSVGLLRGIQDIKVPMVIAVISYWGIGVPAAWILAFPLEMGGVGVWLGLAIGLSLSGVLLTIRFALRSGSAHLRLA